MKQLYYGRHRLTFRAGTYLALIRMMGIAHLVIPLYGHAQLVSATHERLRRTRQTIWELIVHGIDSGPGQAAIQRLRTVHESVAARPEDYRYVLGAFFLEPLRWNDAFARERLTADETERLLEFWLAVGKGMGIDGMPRTLDGWRAEQTSYESRHLCMPVE